MKRVLLVATFILISLFCKASPTLQFSEQIKDLGTIPQFKTFTWKVKVKNLSSKPVTFTSIITTRGCTLAKPGKKTLKGGEETTFIIKFNSQSFEGRVEKIVFVKTSTKEMYDLRIRAIVKREYYAEPSNITVSNKEEYFEQLIEIKSFKNKKPVQIKKIELPILKNVSYTLSNSNSFVLKMNPSKIKKEGKYVIRVYLKNYKHSVPVILIIKKPQYYSVYPSNNLLFLNVKEDRDYISIVTVKSKEPFNIVSQKTGLPCLKLEKSEKVSDCNWKLTFRFQPYKAKTLSGKKTVLIKTDSKKIKDVKLNLVFHIIK